VSKIKAKIVESVVKEQNKAQEENEDMKKKIRAYIGRGRWEKKRG
jgi:hypothetical protein